MVAAETAAAKFIAWELAGRTTDDEAAPAEPDDDPPLDESEGNDEGGNFVSTFSRWLMSKRFEAAGAAMGTVGLDTLSQYTFHSAWIFFKKREITSRDSSWRRLV